MDTQRTGNETRVHLLWTGGWDSTFRLLQLLLVHRMPVVPHYLEDATRASTGTERATMARIRDHLHEHHPHTRALLHPLRTTAVPTLPEDADIADALRAVRERSFIGSQYGWLPAYCRRVGIDDMELGVHVDDKVQALLRPFAMRFRHPAGFDTIRVDPAHAGSAEYRLFRYFDFPLFDIDKLGMEREARRHGWDAIMEMTCFCHAPVRGQPCGLCPPCRYTIEEGLARRVPRSRRALSFLYRHLALPALAPLKQRRAMRRASDAGR